jgi:Tfp pilus assembly protein PilO
MSDDLTIAYMLGVEDMRSRLHKQADEIERLRAENETLRRDVKTAVMGDSAELQDVKRENEKLHREAAIRIDQIEREQEAHLRTIADYNRAAVKNEKLHKALEPFARMAADYEDWETEKITMIVLLYHLRDAAAAIRESGG